MFMNYMTYRYINVRTKKLKYKKSQIFERNDPKKIITFAKKAQRRAGLAIDFELRIDMSVYIE